MSGPRDRSARKESQVNTRRAFIKTAAAAGVGLGVLPQTGVADSITPPGDILPPEVANNYSGTNNEHSERATTSPHGYDGTIETEVVHNLNSYGMGRIEAYDDTNDDFWVFSLAMTCNVVNGFKSDDGNYESVEEIFDGDEGVEIEVKTNPSIVETSLYTDVDWGTAIADKEEHDYSWGDAAIESVNDARNELNPFLSSLHSAYKIYSHWDKAERGDISAGIDWSIYQLRESAGHYVHYQHAIPVPEEREVYDFSITSRVNKALYRSDQYSTNIIPGEEYEHTFDYSLVVPGEDYELD